MKFSGEGLVTRNIARLRGPPGNYASDEGGPFHRERWHWTVMLFVGGLWIGVVDQEHRGRE